MTAAGKTGLTRRHFIMTASALFSPPVAGPLLADSWPSEAQKSAWDAEVTPPFFDLEVSNPWGLDPRFLPQRVEARAGLVPGSIHVDAIARYLYHIEEGGTAMRYGVAIARGKSLRAGHLHDPAQGPVATLDPDALDDRAGPGTVRGGRRRNGTRH